MRVPALPSSDWWRCAAREVWLPTAAEMAEIDRVAVESGAIPERALIENAGRALARHVQERFPTGRVAVLAGSGHNGADALVAGRTLSAWGRSVGFVRCGSRTPDPDVLAGWSLALEPPEALDRELAAADVVIDGILGTGLTSAPRPPQAAVIERVNAARVAVVSADGPSGVDFTAGRVPGAAIRADLTVTFGWPKTGLLSFPARERVGDLISAEIGFPPPEPLPSARAVTAAWVAGLLGVRAADGHKGDSGYLAIIGGERGMAGAVVLAARAAIRAGAGIVRVVSAPENRKIVQTGVPEAVFVDWSAAEAVRSALDWAGAVAVGPGLGRGPGRAGLMRRVLEGGSVPLVIDADALNVLSAEAGGLPGPLAPRRPVLLTPHPGEMARLLGTSVSEVRADAPAAARRLADATRATVLLKGAPTWVARPGGELRATTLVSPAFASGGMGDVLTGACCACLASGLGPADAASAALTLTALAILRGVDEVGGSAADVPDALPEARRALERARPGAWTGVNLALPAVPAAAAEDGSG
ncbi:MAG: NAD(P)H-hydrate dehydratase [Gemmatimonadota bacterium]|uniref:NAD(P)H-hydrate dehydratase n=1 Tax=Candidatus Palauibacter scopulicola TaxID=3056741 RepID=UPI002397F11A|nr:NAD(P)H-hydrate dehydratase [Candidatus Palauibacter scopulicola]MDE2663924.1 NAD(P)H-hydrate dehydratase [Candidatus Palauibacter scopulicola]